MIFPSADTIQQNVGSRYSLVVLAAKRAKQIKEGAPLLIDTESTNPLTIALEEIAAGKVTVLEAGAIVPASRTTAEESGDDLGAGTTRPDNGVLEAKTRPDTEETAEEAPLDAAA